MNRCLIYDCFWDPGVPRHPSVTLFFVLVVCRCCFSADWFFPLVILRVGASRFCGGTFIWFRFSACELACDLLSCVAFGWFGG